MLSLNYSCWIQNHNMCVFNFMQYEIFMFKVQEKSKMSFVESLLIHIWLRIRIYENLAFRICRPWSMKSKFSKVNYGQRSLTEMISNLFESSKSGTCWSVIVCRVFGLLRDVGRAVGHRLDVWHVRCRRGRRYTVLPATPGTQFCLTKENCLWN